ncbi:molybdopterin-synthase adenylyltransferase MoeB, partial [Pseudomonas asplenii]|uniref:molybdopterin-synthase adenylyltransferase MoeB n=2 Tax=Pseudomonas TaxID=286 RepID=UPI0006B51D5C
MLNDQELLRYSRQILLRQVDIDGQLRLKHSRVLIVGLGGLGAPVALYLAAAGVGELHLADFDSVDLTNLQRQIIHDTDSVGSSKVDSAVRRLTALNPEVRLVAHRQALDEDSLGVAIAAVDLVLDCCDNFATREAVNAACVAAGKPLVSGAAIRLEGQLSVFDPRRADSPCYHCLYGHGSEAELTCSEAGVVGPLVGLVGSLQALEALKLLAGFGDPLVGRLLLVDALSTKFREL